MTIKKTKKSYKRYSLSKKLREENKSNDFFELMLTNLTIEELIGLKLECTFRSLKMDLYGFPIFEQVASMAKEGMVNFILSYTGSRMETRRILGISAKKLKQIMDAGEYKC